MEGLIIWLIIIGFAIYNSKKKKNAKTAGGRQQNYQQRNYGSQQGYQARTNSNPNMAQMQAQMTTKQQELKNRLQQKYVQAAGTSGAPVRQNVPYRASQQTPQNSMPQQRPTQQESQRRPAQQAPQNRPMQRVPQQNDIMSRAVANVKENEADELEKSQSVTVEKDTFTDVHNMIGAIDVAKTSDLMAQISDLMIMGYRADLSFERDFVAEGIDMLNSYEMPGI